MHTVALIVGLAVLTGLSAYLLWSWGGVVAASVAIAIILLLGPRVPFETVMRFYRAEEITPERGGELSRILEALAVRAKLPVAPRLYVIPSMTLNAFATGRRDRSAIAVTEGLLRRLDTREVAGVLAHEMSHIRNNDLAVMTLADALTRYTQLLAYIAVFLTILSLPLVFAGVAKVSWLAILLLYLAPTAGSLLQLALSRTREYDADLDGAMLTGDPRGLASALRRLDHYQGRFWEDMMMPVPGRRMPQPSLLRSHPATDDRVARLMEIEHTTDLVPLRVVSEPLVSLAGVAPTSLQPRFRFPGIWY